MTPEVILRCPDDVGIWIRLEQLTRIVIGRPMGEPRRRRWIG
jgi:hypothetical protein